MWLSRDGFLPGWLLIGTLYIAGYRWYRFSFYAVGAIFGFVFSYCLLSELTQLPFPLVVSIAGSIGFSCGFLSILSASLSLFLLSTTASSPLASLLLTVLYYFCNTRDVTIMSSTLLGLVICHVAACFVGRLRKMLIIVSTSNLGGALLTAVIDSLSTGGVLLDYMYSVVTGHPADEICVYNWVVLISWPLALVAGVFIQRYLTSRHINHKFRTSVTVVIRMSHLCH